MRRQIQGTRFTDENGVEIKRSAVRAGMLVTETDYDLGSGALTVVLGSTGCRIDDNTFVPRNDEGPATRSA